MRSEEIIRIIYDNFSSYFKLEDIIIGGSYFYSRIGIPLIPSFKDLDLIVNSSKDLILYELNDFFKKSEFGYDTRSSFIKNFSGDNLISCIVFNNNYPPIDILRNDFSTNLSNIEIIPGVFSNYQTSEKLVEVYNELIESFQNNVKIDSIKKFKILRDFYKNNSTEDLVKNLPSISLNI